MFKNLRHKVVCLFLVSAKLVEASSIEWAGDLNKNTKNYLENFRDFRYQVCKKNSEATFENLLKKFRGEGFWVPELNGDVDIEAIAFVLPEVREKLSWIKNEKIKVQSLKKFKLRPLKDISKTYEKLMSLKKNELQSDESLKIKSRQESLKLLTKIQNDFILLTKDYSFFTNYKFPVDHLRNRKIYDMVKVLNDEESKKYANKVFLQRKVLEDGTYLKNHSNSDIYFRTTLDTLFFELKQHDFYLTENARYDLDFVLDKMSSELDKGRDRIIERLSEWEKRTEKFLAFYEDLIKADHTTEVIVNGVKTTKNKELISRRNEATNKLKDYAYKKQAEVYKYWLSKTELERAVFVIETILMNEVGPVDGEDALERMDVARVVLNRFNRPKYGKISEEDFIYPYIRSLTQESKIEDEKWLNLLFKQGEFSFTYYYMTGAAKIFCPDISPAAKKLRQQNVEIAHLALKEGPTIFQTTRYFSRASMIGRIHMDSVWEDYKPFPERPGLLVRGQEKLRSQFKKGGFTYLYSFNDPESRNFNVIKIQDQTYSVTEIDGIQVFYQHRNPHYFRYFTKFDG